MASPSARRTSTRSARRTTRTAMAGHMVFTARNYTLLGIALALILVGYGVMRAENAVDGFLSLYVAPLLLLGGYLGAIYAILWRPREESRP